MTRAEYQARRAELRRMLHIPCPPEEVKWRQPLARAHWAETRRETCEQLHRLEGGGYTRTTARQDRIAVLARMQARRNAQRAALKALREAGADDSDITRADWRMRTYNLDPSCYMRKAAELREMRA
ncbi:MAG TPA: hypothetical protein VIN36_03090 [Thiobacillus sp.]